MSDELVAKFRVELEGKNELNDFFDRGSKGADKFGKDLSRAFQVAGTTISAFAGKAKSELQAFAGKELGGSLGSQARGVLELRDAINKLAVSAGGGQEMVSGLKDEIHKISAASNQLQGDVTAALSAFVERSGRLDIARKNMDAYAKTATATSASLEDVSRVGETLFSKFNITDQAKSFAILITQAKQGAIEMRDIATQGNSIFTAARAANIGGKGHEEEGVREIGGFLQAVAGGARGKGKTTAADTAVQVAAIFSQIRQKSNKIEEDFGVHVTGRNYIDVVRDLIAKTGGDSQALGKIFKNDRAFRGVATIAKQYKDDGGFKTLDFLTNLGADTAQIDRDFATRRGTGEAKLKAQQIAIAKFADTYGGGISEFAAEHALELKLGAVGLGIGGKGLSLAGNLLGGKGGSVGGVLSSVAATPVRVVNWPSGFGGSGGGDASSLGKGAPLLAVAGGPAAIAAGALAYTAVHDKLLDVPMKQVTNELIDDLRSGRKRARRNWIGGTSYDSVPASQQVQAAGEYERSMRPFPDHYQKTFGHAPPQVNITIHSNENLEISGDSGTRDPKVMDRRGGGG